METKKPSRIQLLEAPATMAKMELRKRDTLKANLRPMMSALPPYHIVRDRYGDVMMEMCTQNKAPTSMPA